MSSFRAARDTMGTRIEILLRGPDDSQLRAVAEEVLDEIASLDQRWSAFRGESEVSDLNRRAAREPVRVSADLMDLLIHARKLWKSTDGAFDPALGNLMQHWGFRRGPGAPDSPKCGLAETLAITGMQQVELDESRREVQFLQPGPQLDLGAIGKGYALDVAAEVCRQEGVDSALIHAGTSSVVGVGPAQGEPWLIGIPTVETARKGWTTANCLRQPRGEALLAQVELKDAALGLSAPWGQTVCQEGEDRGHILDPRTGRPTQAVLMAAVVAARATDADALATALVVGGEDLQRKQAARSSGWRSLIVVRDAEGGAHKVICEGLTADR